MASAEFEVAEALQRLLTERKWKVARDPLIDDRFRADFMLQRWDGVTLLAKLTLETGAIHFASLGQLAAYRSEMSPRGEGQFGFVLLTTGTETSEVTDIARELEVRVISADAGAEADAIASEFADQLDDFSHFAGFGADKPPWALASPFSRASDAEIAKLEAHVTREEHRADETIYRVGTPPDELYVVTSGKVRLTRPGDHGEKHVGWRHQLSVFGEMAAVDGRPRIVTARATTDVEVWKVPTPAFLELLSTSAAVRQGVHDVLTQITRDQMVKSSRPLDVLRDIALALRNAPPPAS